MTVHLITIRISPVIWQDEVQIVDYGRVFLEPGTPWSVSFTPEGGPLGRVSYIGSLGQELAYRATGRSMAGPRVLSFLGALLAAYAAFRWLSLRNGLPVAALSSTWRMRGVSSARVGE